MMLIVLTVIIVMFLLLLFAESGNWVSAGLATSIVCVLMSSVIMVSKFLK